MTASGTPIDDAGHQLVREMVHLYSRYAELIAKQEAALDDGELQEFQAFDDELRTVQQAIGLSPEASSRARNDPRLEALRAEATESLREAQATHSRIQAKLASLREASRTEIRQMARDSSPARRYMEASASFERGDDTHFDETS